MLEIYYLENIVLTEHKLRCPAIPSQKRVLNQIQVRSVIELESFNSHLQLLFISLLTTKTRGFLFPPSPPALFLTSFLLSSQHSLRTPAETLATQAIWLFVFLSFFLFFFSSIFFHTIISLQSLKKKPVFNGHSWLIADGPA